MLPICIGVEVMGYLRPASAASEAKTHRKGYFKANSFKQKLLKNPQIGRIGVKLQIYNF